MSNNMMPRPIVSTRKKGDITSSSIRYPLTENNCSATVEVPQEKGICPVSWRAPFPVVFLEIRREDGALQEGSPADEAGAYSWVFCSLCVCFVFVVFVVCVVLSPLFFLSSLHPFSSCLPYLFHLNTNATQTTHNTTTTLLNNTS